MNMIGEIHDIVWGPWTPVLFLMVGTVYSVRIRFFQVRKIPCWWDATIGNLLRDRKNHRESFRSACTALAATIGTGNITGVAAAVIAGGPGAVFWMWVSAFLGMATAYGETVLGIRYREKDQNGGWMAGPMMYLEKRLGCPRAAVLYGFFCIPAAFGMGSMVQANAISETVSYVYGIPEAAVGMILVVLAGIVLAGGGRPGWYAVWESADGFPNFKAPVETSTSPENESATLFFHKTALVMRRKHFLILIYHSLYKIYRLINSIEIKTEFVKKIFIFEAIWCCEQQYL